MYNQEILNQVQNIFHEVLDNEDIVLANDTTADDIEQWDSLVHIQLIDAIQKKFNIKFTAKEMLSWNNIGELVECIANKCSQL